jgi:hypothetical protein
MRARLQFSVFRFQYSASQIFVLVAGALSYEIPSATLATHGTRNTEY